MRVWRFWKTPPGSWRSGASDGAAPPGGRQDSAFGAAVIATTTTAAAAGAPAVEGVGATAITAAVAAVFPAAGPGSPVPAAIAATTTTAAVTTPFTATAAIAATATAIAAAAGTTPTAATTAARAGLGFVDAQRPAHQLSTLEPIDGPGFGFGIGHLNEGEATLATGVPLEGKGAVHHLAIRGEEFNDVLLLGAEGKIADKNAH